MEVMMTVMVAVVVIGFIGFAFWRTSKKGHGDKVQNGPLPVSGDNLQGAGEDTPGSGDNGGESPQDVPLIPGGKPDMHPADDDDDPSVFERNIDDIVDMCVDDFAGIVYVAPDSQLYAYLKELVTEAHYQFDRGRSHNGLPLLYRRENFPVVYDYWGNMKNEDAAFYTMTGWLMAMQLAELCPEKRNQLYTAGYKAGGEDRESPMFGWEFRSDPNVARLVASAIYAGMRAVKKPDVEKMREEVDGEKYDRTLEQLLDDESRTDVKDEGDFYVDLRQFMASAPGPYAPKYLDRKCNPTFTDDKEKNGNLKMDECIYEWIVAKLNLPMQRAVQAIADEDGDLEHLFGDDKKQVGGTYDFHAVFGPTTIGEWIDPKGELAAKVKLWQRAGGSARGILQHAKPHVGPTEYGRLRPGCSEQQECKRKSYDDDRLNVLTCFVIEDNDGHKETYTQGNIEVPYYDEEGHWTKKNVQSEEDYENLMKDSLYANSYPSGHSSGIWAAALVLMESYPEKADLIMRAANSFAVSRTVARFHWTSDTIQGRVVGSCMAPLCHATSNY